MEDLEKKVEKSERKFKLREYLVDTPAGTTFFQPMFAFNEICINGLDLETCLKARAFSLGANLLLNRPYGKFREYWANRWKTDHTSSRLKKFFVDTSALIAIQAPIYTAILIGSGSDYEKTITAVPTALTLSMLLGRPYGFYLDKVRKTFKTKPTLDRYVDNF